MGYRSLGKWQITLKGLVLRGLCTKYIQPRKTKPVLYEEVFFNSAMSGKAELNNNNMENLKDLKKKLEKVEKELEKVRGKEYEQPFGSMRRAKISRKWDELAKTKSILQTLIYDLEK